MFVFFFIRYENKMKHLFLELENVFNCNKISNELKPTNVYLSDRSAI